MTKNKSLELYFHIPFCVSKCNYCDFLSTPAEDSVQRRYLQELIRETVEQSRGLSGFEVTTVFLGGGTPSLIPAEGIESLLAAVRNNYRMTAEPEISMEINPGTAGAGALARYRAAGVSRLSIGLQSALDRELVRLGRIHTLSQFLETYRQAREAGFTNINIDVMSALPGQTREDYRVTLETVLGLVPQPEHISAYSLIVEEGTPFAREAEAGALNLPDEECERLMYEDTGRLLAGAGYRRYEISNYARPGYECRHNLGYWRRTDYRGFGLGAASLINNVRFSNTCSLEEYLGDPTHCARNVQRLTVQEQMEEFLFLGLRTADGVDARAFEAAFGRPLWELYGPVIEQNIRDGLLVRRGDFICPTARGMDLNNYLGAQFLR